MPRLSGIAVVAVVGLVGYLTGCSNEGSYKPSKPTTKAGEHGHDHGHDHDHGKPGPHGGTLVELGEHELHGEVVLDEKGNALRVYLLGTDGKTTATAVADQVKLTPESGKNSIVLMAKPQDGETDGKTSLFELVDEKLVKDLADGGYFHGTMELKVGEKTLTGGVDAHFKDDHDHKDEKKAAESKESKGSDAKPADADKEKAEKKEPATESK